MHVKITLFSVWCWIHMLFSTLFISIFFSLEHTSLLHLLVCIFCASKNLCISFFFWFCCMDIFLLCMARNRKNVWFFFLSKKKTEIEWKKERTSNEHKQKSDRWFIFTIELWRKGHTTHTHTNKNTDIACAQTHINDKKKFIC